MPSYEYEFLQIADRLMERPFSPEKVNTIIDVDRAKFVFMEILREAGFAPHTLQIQALRGNYRDQDGLNTGETYPINLFCPFTVMVEENEFWMSEARLVPDYRASTWLELLVQKTKDLRMEPFTAESKLRDCIVQARPLEPIGLSEFGDTLIEFPGDLNSHVRDDDLIWQRAGSVMHRSCRGTLEMVGCSDFYRVLTCKKCNFRMYIPVEVQTFGQLRQYALRQIAFKNAPAFSPIGEVKNLDSLCPVCGLKQFATPSGTTCSNGHGGAEAGQ
jgi:hypothetical protein